jgi:PPM family protein phosphatase
MVVPEMTPLLHWSAHGVTDRGRRRRRNEDALFLRPEAGVYAVADGMGGHAAGDVASRIAVDTLRDMFGAEQPATAAAAADRLMASFAAANAAILAHAAAHHTCSGMGTTMTALATAAAQPTYAIAHIGDSRAYRLRDGSLTQLTSDHTWVQQQVESGMLTPAEARHHARSSVLYRVLGIEGADSADVLTVEGMAGDVVLLCSDGLTAMLEDEDIRTLLLRGSDPHQAVTELVGEANRRGGVDNISVVLLQARAAA